LRFKTHLGFFSFRSCGGEEGERSCFNFSGVWIRRGGDGYVVTSGGEWEVWDYGTDASERVQGVKCEKWICVFVSREFEAMTNEVW